jgi:hypothetical protein
MEDESGRPRSHKIDENVENVRNLVHSDRGLSNTAMAVQLSFGKYTVRQILSDDLGMKKVSTKVAPGPFTDEQKSDAMTCVPTFLVNWKKAFSQRLSLDMNHDFCLFQE